MLEQANSTLFTLVSPSLQALSSSLSTKPVLLSFLLHDYLTWSTAWKIVLFIFIATNFKVFPFIYHLRILNAVRFVLRSQRPPKAVGPSHLFQPLITSSRTCLMEIDVLGHKSNSTYFYDVDVARIHLVTTLFTAAIEKVRGSTTMNGMSGKPNTKFNIALGAVSCTFRKELRPYEQYDMWTRILAWDQKWFYLVTHFVRKGARLEPEEFTLYPQQNSQKTKHRRSQKSTSGQDSSAVDSAKGDNAKTSPICATALSKIVFKNSRLTLTPEVMLETAGLLPPKLSSTEEKEQAALNAQLNAGGKPMAKDAGSVTWTREMIEAERQRGLEIAKLLGEQTVLEEELHPEVALGRHHDGFGVEGVVATLAQLGKISRYQLL